MATKSETDPHVIVTIYTPPDRSAIVNTYGPYTKSMAQYWKQQMELEAVHAGISQHFTAKVSRLLDPDGRASYQVVRLPDRKPGRRPGSHSLRSVS